MILAVWTVAMPTGMRYISLVITFTAARQHTGAQVGTANLHGTERLAVRGQNPGRVLSQKIRFELVNDRRE